ncbi:MAG: DMT family transporter [Deltaproteobacteria bacterium]
MAFPIHELAALGTATCWAATALFSSGPAGWLGAPAFNRLRQIAVTLMLALVVGISGSWRELSGDMMLPLVLSGLLGITLGDTLNFATVVRLGPRRAGVLFALNAPMAACLGWVFLGETLATQTVIGILICFCGTVLAIRFGGKGGHQLDAVKGSLAVGISLGLLAAFGQATGSILARPIMAGGLDAFAASLVRVGFAGAALSVLMSLPIPALAQRNPLNRRIFLQTIGIAFLGLMVGMTLMLYALQGGKVGIITTLTATSPVIILPMLWLKMSQRPAPGACAGAGLVVVGMALIFLR